MIGTVIGVTALIPVLGCYLGAIVGALMCLSVSPFKAVEFLVFIFCLQQLEDNLIYPRVVGTSLGLPGIWVIASVSVGGGIGGIIGMILAVPITATVYQLLRMDVQKREQADSRKMTAADVVGKLKEEADK
jgi:predicted PurR-regulated permease PerM